MQLTNVIVEDHPQVDDSIIVKADFGDERVFTEISRIALHDYFPHRPSLTSRQRQALAESNVEVIAGHMASKCERGEWRIVSRAGSYIKQIDITKADLLGGPRLSDARLVVDEKAGFSGAFR
jgi:hypothetical protein